MCIHLCSLWCDIVIVLTLTLFYLALLRQSLNINTSDSSTRKVHVLLPAFVIQLHGDVHNS